MAAVTEGDSVPVELEAESPRFGPRYGEDTRAIDIAKNSSWEHILVKSADSGTKNAYMSLIADEKERIESYYGPSAVAEKLKPEEIRWMMVRDGCFFLQLALHILGGELDYPANNPYFGNNKYSTSLIPAMFFVENQIPCVVIRALMKQKFFKELIGKGNGKAPWRRPPDALPELALYLTVVEPELERPGRLFSTMMFGGKAAGPGREPPSDILRCLHALLLGTVHNDRIDSEMKGFHDLEAGREDSSQKIPSARELYKSGIWLRKSKRGISNIRFCNRVCWAYLYLPPFTVDAQTKDILTSLVIHEKKNLNDSYHVVTAYIGFMKDLVRTQEDFKSLEKKGIIQVKEKEKEDDDFTGPIVSMLKDYPYNSSTLNFRHTRRKITDYGGPPWRLISFFLGVLTVVQTIFTVLSYFFPHK